MRRLGRKGLGAGAIDPAADKLHVQQIDVAVRGGRFDIVEGVIQRFAGTRGIVSADGLQVEGIDLAVLIDVALKGAERDERIVSPPDSDGIAFDVDEARRGEQAVEHK